MKLSIEITEIDRIRYRIDGIKGKICVDGFGGISFEIFRSEIDKTGELKLRVYDDTISIIIPGFKGFYSSDFDNRKIIQWIGTNAIDLVWYGSIH